MHKPAIDTERHFSVCLNHGVFRFADTPELKSARLGLVTECYLSEGFITSESLSNLKGELLFIDPFEERGDPYVVIDEKGTVVASVRLVFGTLNRIPMGQLELHEKVRKRCSRQRWCEWTQVVIAPEYRGSSRLFFDITQIAMRIAVKRGARYWAAVVNQQMRDMIVNRFGTDILPAGNPQQRTEAPYRDPGPMYPLMASPERVMQKFSFKTGISGGRD